MGKRYNAQTQEFEAVVPIEQRESRAAGSPVNPASSARTEGAHKLTLSDFVEKSRGGGGVEHEHCERVIELSQKWLTLRGGKNAKTAACKRLAAKLMFYWLIGLMGGRSLILLLVNLGMCHEEERLFQTGRFLVVALNVSTIAASTCS